MTERLDVRRVDAHHVKPLGEALMAAFLRVQDLVALLHHESLGKEFDNLASRDWPLGRITQDIAGQAFEQGWAGQLLRAALLVNPDNPRLRELWITLPEGADLGGGADGADGVDRDDRPSLLCGRAAQWNEVCQSAPARQHHVIVVSGAEGQDPMHFRDRIETWLQTDPPRSIVRVDWPRRPASRAAFFEALGRALEIPDSSFGDDAALRATVARRLNAGNLVLLHDCVTLKFDDEPLVQYYTEWLPDLVRECPNANKLKCVQPIEWPATKKSVWSKLLGDAPADPHGETGARALIERLTAAAAAALPAIPLTELTGLTPPEITSFVRTSGLTPKQQARMLEEVSSVEPVPERIFQTIDACWCQVEAIQ